MVFMDEKVTSNNTFSNTESNTPVPATATKKAETTQKEPSKKKAKTNATFKLSEKTNKEIEQGSSKLGLSKAEFLSLAVHALHGELDKKAIDALLESKRKVNDIFSV
jgi:hypothetical protein